MRHCSRPSLRLQQKKSNGLGVNSAYVIVIMNALFIILASNLDSLNVAVFRIKILNVKWLYDHYAFTCLLLTTVQIVKNYY